MSRYIDEIFARENFQDVLAYMGSEVKRMLKKIPTADVVEVRHGEWVKKHRHRGGFRTVTVTDSFGEEHTGGVDTRYECDDLYCSVCGKIAHDAFLNYCANCGAKMDGERSDNG